MKRKILFLALFFILKNSYSQSTIDSAFHLLPYNYLNYNPSLGSMAPMGPDYGCVSRVRPVWFNFYVCGGDTDSNSSVWLDIFYSSFDPIGMIVWGPFDDTLSLASKLTTTNIDTCFTGILPLPPLIYLRHLQFGKLYVGMISVDSMATFSQMFMRSNGYWTDNRCGISNARVANYKQDICMVTIDSSTQNNMLVWENKYNYQTASFNIYREGVIANQFDSIGNVPVMSTSTFVDNGVNPNQRSYRYIMSAVDSSGHTEKLYNPNHDSAQVHVTIHVQASPGLQGEVNLAWNAYVGFTYNTFYIYRGSSPTNLQILDSVSAATFAYTDFTPPPGINYYKIAVHRTGGCSPDGGTTVYIQAISNPPYAMVLGIENPEHSDIILVGPNPFSEEILLTSLNEIPGGMVTIYDSFGKKVYEEEFNGTEKLIKHCFANGLYTLFVFGNHVNYTRKIVKE